MLRSRSLATLAAFALGLTFSFAGAAPSADAGGVSFSISAHGGSLSSHGSHHHKSHHKAAKKHYKKHVKHYKKHVKWSKKHHKKYHHHHAPKVVHHKSYSHHSKYGHGQAKVYVAPKYVPSYSHTTRRVPVYCPSYR